MIFSERASLEGKTIGTQGMPFLALTGAPFLREGVKLNIMATPQSVNVAPPGLGPGETVIIRFGHCCPTIEEAIITAMAPDHAVLRLGSTDWIIEPCPKGNGVTVPGIISEDWFVR